MLLLLKGLPAVCLPVAVEKLLNDLGTRPLFGDVRLGRLDQFLSLRDSPGEPDHDVFEKRDMLLSGEEIADEPVRTL